MNILVLGANSYTGTRLVEQLLAQGHQVRGLVRDQDKSVALEKRGLEIRVGDLTNPEAAKTLARDVQVIFFMVGYCRSENPVMRAILETGINNLFAEIPANQLRKFIFASNVAGYGSPKRDFKLDENSPLKPTYTLGKVTVEAEKRLREKFPSVTVRVPNVYGPDRNFISALRAGTLRILNTGENWQSRIHVDDLVRVLIAAMEQGNVGEVFLAGDDQPTTQKEFFTELALALQVNPPLHLEVNAARALGGAFKALSWFSGQATAALNESVIGLLTNNYFCVNAKIKTRLGIQLEYPSYLDAYEKWLTKGGENV